MDRKYYVTGHHRVSGNYKCSTMNIEYGTLVFRDNFNRIVEAVAAGEWFRVEEINE